MAGVSHRHSPKSRSVSTFQSVAVLGAGAMGAFYGSKLQRAGLSVEYQSAAMAKTRRLRVNSIWGDYSIPVRAFARSNEMQPADLILVSLKALPEIRVYDLLLPLLKEESVVLLLQNGINQEERLAQQFREATRKSPVLRALCILGGLAFTCINRISASHIDHLDYGLIKIGALRSRDAPVVREATALFQSAGVICEAVPDLRQARWEKLLWNAAYNTLSVLLGSATDLIVNFESTAALSVSLMHEIQAVAAADGYRLRERDVVGMLDKTKRMNPYKTSMLLDYEAGRPMEVEAILGEVVRIARRKRVSVPQLKMAYDLLCFLDVKRLRQEK